MIVPTSPPNTPAQLHVIGREIEDEGPKVSYSYDQTSFGDGTVLLVENTLFRVPRTVLERSETFSAKYLSARTKVLGPSSAAETQIIRLDGYLAAEFRLLLRVLTPSQQTSSNEFSKDEAVLILKLATELDFPGVRWSAIQALGQRFLHDPVFQLILAKKYDVRQWLVPSLKAIVGPKSNLDLRHVVTRLSTELDTDVMRNLGPRLVSLRKMCLDLVSRYPSTVLDFTDAICTVFECDPDGQPVERFRERTTASQIQGRTTPTSEPCTDGESTSSVSECATEITEPDTPATPPPSSASKHDVKVRDGRCTCTKLKLVRAVDLDRETKVYPVGISAADEAVARRRAIRRASKAKNAEIQAADDEVAAAAIAFKLAQMKAQPLCKKAQADRAYAKQVHQSASQLWFGRLRLNGAQLVAQVSAERAKPEIEALAKAEQEYAAAQRKLKELIETRYIGI